MNEQERDASAPGDRMMRENSRLTFRYSLAQGAFWGTWCVMAGFCSSFLSAKGFSNTQIGIVIAVSGIISSFLQIMLADWVDRREKVTAKHVLLVLSAAQIASSGMIGFLSGTGLPLLGVYTLHKTLLYMSVPFISAIGMETINQGKRMDYSFARGIGSLGYALWMLILGQLVERIGADMVWKMGILSSAMLFLAVRYFPFSKHALNVGEAGETDHSAAGGPADQAHRTAGALTTMGFVRRYPRFMGTLLGCTLVLYGYSVINDFSYQVVVSKGGGNAEMGIIMAIAALTEIPMMFLFGRISGKMRYAGWLLLSSLFIGVRITIIWLAPAVSLLYLGALLQFLGYAIFVVVTVCYVSEVVRPEEQLKGQAFMAMTSSVAAVFSSLVGGMMLDHTSVFITLAVTLAVTLAGVLLIGLTAEQKRV